MEIVRVFIYLYFFMEIVEYSLLKLLDYLLWPNTENSLCNLTDVRILMYLLRTYV